MLTATSIPLSHERFPAGDPAEASGRRSLSIVIPCYNEEAAISETVRRLNALCDTLNDLSIELIFVDDGSSDRTFELLEQHVTSNRRIKVVGFARNFGHQIAVTAGIDASNGDAVVLIDADLQDPPELITAMVEKWLSGY